MHHTDGAVLELKNVLINYSMQPCSELKKNSLYIFPIHRILHLSCLCIDKLNNLAAGLFRQYEIKNLY